MSPKRADLEIVEAQQRRSAPVEAPGGTTDAPESEPSLADYVDVLRDHRWTIALVALAAVVLGGAYAFLATPVYRSNALVQVEEKKGGLAGMEEFSAIFSAATPAETEIEILRSRALVGAVVDELRLDIVAAPRRMPIFGKAVARLAGREDRISVQRLEVPPALVDKPLALAIHDGKRFTLRDPNGASLLEGASGTRAEGGGAEIFVAGVEAPSGTEFRVVRRDRDDVVEKLQKELRIAEKGKRTGILQLSLEGEDPGRVAATLDALSHAYLRQNVERRSAEAAQTLEFLETQLPKLREDLQAAEAALEAHKQREGGLDVSLEAKAAIERAGDVEKALGEFEVERAALRKKFTESHPAIAALDQKIERLRAERATVERRIHGLPENEVESARRLRDVQVANALYVTLLNKAQELKIVRSGTIGNVRILDAAIVPQKPVSPRKAAVLALSLLLGLGLGVAAAFGRRALDRGVQDPDAIERTTGVPIYAAVPESAVQKTATRRAGREGNISLLAVSAPGDLAIESLRSLRTSLEFALVESPSRIVAVGGPAPGVGKSFVTSNLAHLLGESGRRVLVLDCDLRRGHLHRVLGGSRAPGLSDVLGGAAVLSDALRDTSSHNVRFLSSGTIPPNPAELLGSERFQRLLSDVSAQYDLVLLDAPPILAVTDAALVGRNAGVNLFVLRAGRHPMREIVAALRQAARSGLKVNGFVLNAIVMARAGRSGSYHYQYDYR